MYYRQVDIRDHDNMLNGLSGNITYTWNKKKRVPLGIGMFGVIQFGTMDELNLIRDEEGKI